MADLDDWLAEPGERFAKASKAKGKRKARPEDALHIAVAKLLKVIIAPAGLCSPQRVMWFSIEFRNSGRMITTDSGKKINLEGVRRKAAGCIAGLPDVCVIYQGRLHGIELKAEGGRVSDAQHDTHLAICHAGGITGVARSVDDVVGYLEAWRVPHVKARF